MKSTFPSKISRARSKFIIFGGLIQYLIIEKFPLQFGKQYADAQEEALRFIRFKSNLRIINEHNAAFKAGASSFWMEMNSFIDLNDQEYRALLGYKPKPDLWSAPSTINCTHQDVTVPASVDWREVGAVTSVRNISNFSRNCNCKTLSEFCSDR